jgi:hypothetical protein
MRLSTSRRRWLGALSAGFCCAALAGCSTDAIELAGLGAGPLRTTWDVGSCHRLDQLEQTGAVVMADTSPAVPCTEPHQSETFAVLPLTGAAAAPKERPSPEILQRELRGVCGAAVMGEWLGEQAPDAIRDISVQQWLPSVAEWRAGVREIRCDALIGPRDTLRVATISRSLRGIVGTPDSARFRVCQMGYIELTCEKPHQSELAYPLVQFTAAELAANDRKAELAKVDKACQGIVKTYLGEPIAKLSGYALDPEPPGSTVHPDSQVGRCWIGPVGVSKLATGSVRRAGGAG